LSSAEGIFMLGPRIRLKLYQCVSSTKHPVVGGLAEKRILDYHTAGKSPEGLHTSGSGPRERGGFLVLCYQFLCYGGSLPL
jgi:hypothetical protein